MLNANTIRLHYPRARDDYVQALVDGQQEMMAAGLNTPLRLACFLGQCAHETGEFTIVRENMRYSAEQAARLWPHRFGRLDPRLIKAAKAIKNGDDGREMACVLYSGRTDLGNEGGEDGWDFRGGGFLQHTGRACYEETGNAIGVDLLLDPQMIEDPAVSLSASLYIWNKHGLNRFADRGYIRAIGNAINRGSPFREADPIGHDDRQVQTRRCMMMLGTGLPQSEELALGAFSPKVRQLQERLKELGYQVGGVDGVFGPTLARAVAAFKLDHQRQAGEPLELAELVGPLTWRALDHAQPIQISPEREGATVATLLSKGSTEAAAGREAQVAGRVLAAGGFFEGARQLGVVDTISLYSSKISTLRLSLMPLMDAFAWASKHVFFLVLIATGVWVWVRGRHILMARLEAHRSGANLGR